MKFIVDKQIFNHYPNTLLGVAVLHNTNNKGTNNEIEKLLRKAEKEAVQNLGKILIIEHPHIASWREAYKKFGAKPKDYPSSIENLLRRVVKGNQVRHINKLVDIYNIISLKYLLPVGGEDLTKIKGNVLLTIAGNNEPPMILLGEKETRPPHPNEIIYKDDISAICRRWNWKEAERTKLTEETKDAFIVIEGIPPVNREAVQTALTNLIELLKKYCGGNISTAILDANKNQIQLI